MKFGTLMQGPNTNTPANFQGHPPIITHFTPHMCDIQGHWAKMKMLLFTLVTHLEYNSVEIGDHYIV